MTAPDPTRVDRVHADDQLVEHARRSMAGDPPGLYPLHSDVQRVLEHVVEALMMVRCGVFLPYGEHPLQAGPCTEAETASACDVVLEDARTLLSINTAKRWMS